MSKAFKFCLALLAWIGYLEILWICPITTMIIGIAAFILLVLVHCLWIADLISFPPKFYN